jgi:hypothetical protein
MSYIFKNGIDGAVPVGELPSDGCCPPDICSIDPDGLKCSMVSLLPSGPLWDETKQLGVQNCDTCEPCEEPFMDEQCASLVLHAHYKGALLYYYIMAILWPALREANPATAWSTMDEWLDRLGWADCYNTYCRDPDLGPITPYEIVTECSDHEYCPPVFGEELTRIYKRGVILALWRMRHGSVENLAAINFIISSLYAEVVPQTDAFGKVCLILRPTQDYAPVVLPTPCPETESTILQAQKQVKLYLTPGNGLCIGGPDRAYPLVLAAHCIVRSLLPICCNICLKRQP